MLAFLRRQWDEAQAFNCDASLAAIEPLGTPATRFLVGFSCRGLVRSTEGLIEEADEFAVGVSFPPDYLRRADPFRVLTWLGPRNVWHPNISTKAPVICVGRLAPGTGLIDLVYQCWEIITWNKVTMREDDALNMKACQWARANLARLPIDTRPLKRQPLTFRTLDIPPSNHGTSA
jgi:hypothetical protein